MNNESFNPSSFAYNNGNFIGLPYKYEDAKVVLQPVPWEATVSYGHGTVNGPEMIREASYQLDLFDSDVPDAWKIGLFMESSDEHLLQRSNHFRTMAKTCITQLESGIEPSQDQQLRQLIDDVNNGCKMMVDWVFQACRAHLKNDKIVGLIGGDHSTPLGYLKALAEHGRSFGILHIDAHLDLRTAYEGFTYSHASIFHNALESIPQITKLTSVGIRDYCEEELTYANDNDRIAIFYDAKLKAALFNGVNYNQLCEKIVNTLPKQVYVSFDVDGLQPYLCPNTGTPVPGGLTFEEAVYLLNKVVESGRKIIGFDVSETGNAEWDGNVASRIVYKLANLTWKSQN